MCTCITYQGDHFYFARNLDLECSFGEKIVITPRKYVFHFKEQENREIHYAMMGMATVMDAYPLYAEAVNEKGLCIAGLNFPENAVYQERKSGMKNVTPFELIPWILGECASVSEAEKMLENTNIMNLPFRPDIPLTPLHWMIADKEKCIVLEPLKEGLKIYDNPYGILTNNPPFDYHVTNLNNYLNLTSGYPNDRFAEKIKLRPYGQGMGAIGLPGDASPSSRFVKTAFLKWNSVCEKDEMSSITQVFHILSQVAMVKGSVLTREGNCDMTTYSCCISAEKGIYYYTTYENSQICAVKLEEKAEQENLILYELERKQNICFK